jgi:uncharacterized protein
MVAKTPTIPMLSAALFVIPLEGDRIIIYAPLRQAAFVANRAVVNFLADLKEGVWDQAADPNGDLVEFLRQLEILDAGSESPPNTTFQGDPEPTLVTLFLTTACNLRCTYCYASAGDTPTTFMDMEVARRGIDFVAANAKKKGQPEFEIAYHGGGEPTVNWDVMKDSLAYAKSKGQELGLKVFATSATNGVLNEQQLDWVIANLDGASLSFDGLPEAHDRHRLTMLGQGSSERVMHTMRRFDAASFPYGLRVTVTADQIANLPASIEFICKSFSPKRIQVEPAYQLGRWRGAPSAETEEFVTKYREAQERAAALGRELTYSAARVGMLTNHFCGVTQDSFALSPEGNVSSCYEVFSEDHEWSPVFFYGQPDDRGAGYRFDLTKLNHLRNQAVQHRDYCQGCFAKWHCAGDCYHKSCSSTGSTEFKGSERCHITRELTKDQLLAKIAASGGLFWHELPAETDTRSMGKEILT